MNIAANIGQTRGVYLNIPLVDWTLFSELIRKFGWQAENVSSDETNVFQLSPQMEKSIVQAENDYEQGKCITEDSFKQRFAKWL